MSRTARAPCQQRWFRRARVRDLGRAVPHGP